MWFTVKFYINSKIIINVLTLHRLKPVLRTTVSDFHTSQTEVGDRSPPTGRLKVVPRY